jgi:CheY-like chemotaxis protein
MLSTHNFITALLVDDDHLLVRLYKRNALRHRIDLYTASHWEEAVAMLRDGLRPQVMIVDIDMPVMNGIEVLRIVRAEQLIPLTSIIVISPDHPHEHVDELYRLGVDEHVRKWHRFPSDLLRRVADHYGGIDPYFGSPPEDRYSVSA